MDLKSFYKQIKNPHSHTILMGILNITPDSFSDGGKFFNPENAVQQARDMIKHGAEILDIGGESTRPGAEPVSVKTELERVIPVLKQIRIETDVLISIDTYKSEVAEAAIEAGANIVNDISGLQFDPNIADLVSANEIPLILMHSKGKPKSMQVDPHYHNLINEIVQFFKTQITLAFSKGIQPKQIILDPGIGFGKRLEDNFTILRDLSKITELGYPLLVGASRKSFIGQVLDAEPNERLEGTSAAVTASILNGARIIRVHDVKEMNLVKKIADRIRGVSP